MLKCPYKPPIVTVPVYAPLICQRHPYPVKPKLFVRSERYTPAEKLETNLYTEKLGYLKLFLDCAPSGKLKNRRLIFLQVRAERRRRQSTENSDNTEGRAP